jgi:WD40 repeat protein
MLAAILGDPAALTVSEKAPGPFESFEARMAEVARVCPEACLRVAIAIARTASTEWRDRFHGPDDAAIEAIDLVEEWVRAPSDATLAAVVQKRRALLADENVSWRYMSAIRLLEVCEAPGAEVLAEVANRYGYDHREWFLRAIARDVAPWALGIGDPLLEREKTHGVRLGNETGMVRSVSCLPDGKHVFVSTSNGRVALWSIAGRARVREYPHERADLYAGAVSPSGRLGAVGGLDEEIAVYDFESGALVAKWEHPGGQINALVFVDVGRLVSAGAGGHVRVWEAATGKSLFEVDLEQRSFTSLDASGSLVAAGSSEGRVFVVNVDDRSRGAELQIGSSIVDVAFARRELIVAADRQIVAFDLGT